MTASPRSPVPLPDDERDALARRLAGALLAQRDVRRIEEMIQAILTEAHVRGCDNTNLTFALVTMLATMARRSDTDTGAAVETYVILLRGIAGAADDAAATRP